MASREELLRQDAEELKRLGYAQQLFREMGGFSNFAVSFSVISILTGAVLLYGYGLKFAGPIVNTVGWPLVSLMTLTIAASMAELASAYPTAGGLYFWAFRLGGRGWAWTTAWLNMVGQVTITAGINVAAAIYLIGAVTRIAGVPADARVPLFGPVTNWYFQLFVMVLIMIPQVFINVYGIRLTARLNDFSVWWHIGGVVLIVVLMGFFATHHNPIDFLFRFVNVVNPLDASSATLPDGHGGPALVVGDWKVPSPLFALFPGLAHVYGAAPFLLVFSLALLQAQWTYTGYDASAHMAEETMMARKNSAWGIFLSVGVSAVVGFVLLVVLTWAIPRGDVAATASQTYPVLYIVDNNLPRAAANLIAIVIGGAMWLCGCSSISSMARMWYAFARDGGMPGSHWIRKVSPRWGTPVHSIVITSVLCVLISLYAAAFTVLTSISTITLYLAYGIPIYLNLRNRTRRRGEFTTRETAAWRLGRSGPAIAFVALLWVAVITVIFSLPPNELVLWTMLALGVVLGAYWFGDARARFRGPGTATAADRG
jgi:amino acid transporter